VKISNFFILLDDFLWDFVEYWILVAYVLEKDLRVNNLIESQKWPVGLVYIGRLLCGIKAIKFGMGRMEFSLSLLVFIRPICIWIGLGLVERMRFQLWLLDASVSEEEFQRESMVVRQKTKVRKDVLNLKSSINYGDDYATSRRRKSKARGS